MRHPKSSLKATLAGALQNLPRIEFAILFGSLAEDREHGESDIDLAVDAGRPLTATDKVTLIAELAQRIGRPVDLIDLRTAGEPLLGQILKHGVRIVGSNSRYAALIRKHVFDNTDFMPYRDRILRARRHAWIAK